MLLTFILIITSIPSPLTLSFQAQKLFFMQILPTVAYFFFFRTDSMDFPDCLPILLSMPIFHFLVFLFPLLVVGSVR